LDLFGRRRFHLLLKFLHFVDNKNGHVMKQGTTGKTVPFPTLPYGGRLLEARKGIKVQQAAKKCLNIRI
jgi:hypothetical protein